MRDRYTLISQANLGKNFSVGKFLTKAKKIILSIFSIVTGIEEQFNGKKLLVKKLIPEKAPAQRTEFTLRYVDENMLRTPPVAVSQVKREILRMADIALGNVDRSLEMATQLDLAAKPVFERDERERGLCAERE